MNLIIYANEGSEEKALFDLDKSETILVGDYYHGKIGATIDGYIKALSDFDIYNKEIETEWIDNSHEHFYVVGFYCEEE